ncbi:hypothetical protein BD311DRAFT_753870 [Dichomitus squalens]|uniref:Zinc/iron permease n=1 Tax=Dichomitus squalens TaxID=114155 RepID=A0A4Q9MVX9_9APHY|nr:hypothetical protein BD311DRAFT_753870 [Dichomitus squalens]
MGTASILTEVITTGLVSFGFGVIPILTTSQSRLSALATIATGFLLVMWLSLLVGTIVVHVFPGEEPLPVSSSTSALLFIAGFLFSLVAERRFSSSLLRVGRFVRSQPHAPAAHPSVDYAQVGTRLEDVGIPGSSVAQPVTQSLAGDHTSPLLERDELRVYMFAYALIFQLFMEGATVAHQVMGLSETVPSRVEEEQPMELADSDTTSMVIIHGMIAILFTTTLLTAKFSKLECERHLFYLVISGPLAAILLSVVIWLFQIKAAQYEFVETVLNSITAGMFMYSTVAVRLSLGKLQGNTGRSMRKTLLLLATGACGPFVAEAAFQLLAAFLLSTS